MEPGRRADRLSTDVVSMVQPCHHVGQPDRVHVEYRGRIGIVADPARITRNQHQVPDAHRVRPEQIRLDTEQCDRDTSSAARPDPGLLFDQHR
jgi:hypothetical protein